MRTYASYGSERLGGSRCGDEGVAYNGDLAAKLVLDLTILDGIRAIVFDHLVELCREFQSFSSRVLQAGDI